MNFFFDPSVEYIGIDYEFRIQGGPPNTIDSIFFRIDTFLSVTNDTISRRRFQGDKF